jgi:hypothetical protein
LSPIMEPTLLDRSVKKTQPAKHTQNFNL